MYKLILLLKQYSNINNIVTVISIVAINKKIKIEIYMFYIIKLTFEVKKQCMNMCVHVYITIPKSMAS